MSTADVMNPAGPTDPADLRHHFTLPDDMVYLCGNSLGAPPRGVAERMAEVVGEQWGRQLVGGWNAGWAALPRRVADRLAPLIGGGADEIAVGDSTSVMLYKVLSAAVRLRPERSVVVVESTTFPTDGYIAAAVARDHGLELRWTEPDEVIAALDTDVAALCLTHVDFRTGARFDLAGLTAAAHAVGATAVWDLSHSTGALQVELAAADADAAVGCGYKYLNGGPGAPAYAWVHRRHHDALDQPLTGWWGHAEPFAMERDHRAAAGIRKLDTGTPPVLGLSALEAALEVFRDVPPAALAARSAELTGHLIRGLDRRVPELEMITPRDPGRRGSQISLRHPDAYGIVQALIARGVIGDFRAPDIARFGIAPAYTRAADLDRLVEELATVLGSGEHHDALHRQRHAVT